MTYEQQKKDVVIFFDNYVNKYLIPDLKKLDQIVADKDGIGGCAVPQAQATFSAIDLFGFFLDPFFPSNVSQ